MNAYTPSQTLTSPDTATNRACTGLFPRPNASVLSQGVSEGVFGSRSGYANGVPLKGGYPPFALGACSCSVRMAVRGLTWAFAVGRSGCSCWRSIRTASANGGGVPFVFAAQAGDTVLSVSDAAVAGFGGVR